MKRLPFTHERTSTPRATRGMTLLELLLVMAILATVLGGGVGLFAALDTSKRTSLGELKTVMRRARLSAVAESASTRVRIDPKGRRAWAEVLQTVGTWQFEGNMRGALGIDGLNRDGSFVDDGYIGKALGFSGRAGELAELPIHKVGACDLRDGFRFRFALQNDAGGRLLESGRVFSVDVNGAGSIRASFLAQLEMESVNQPGATVIAETEPGVLRPNQWAQVEIVYDRVALRILVDGLEVANTAEDAPVWEIDSTLTIGSNRRPYSGVIDGLVLAVVVAEEPFVLPEDVSFAENTPTEVMFQSGGSLDRRKHEEPVYVTLEFEGGDAETLTVGTFGTVER